MLQGYQATMRNGKSEEVRFSASTERDGFYEKRINGKTVDSTKLPKSEVIKYLKSRFPGKTIRDSVVTQAMQEIEDEMQ